MRIRSARTRGFTLIEGLFAILLTFMVLGALAETLSDTGKIRANRAEMDRAIEEYHALSAIRTDIVAALQVLQPGRGETAASLKLRRVSPELSFLDRIDSSGNPTDAYEASEKIDLRYRVHDQALMRGFGPVDGSLAEQRMQSCHAMQVTHWENSIVLRLTFEYSRVERTRVMKVELR